MAHKLWIVAVSVIVAASASAAASSGPGSARPDPSDSPDSRYCLRVEAVTGTRLERVQCWTRAEWVEQGVDVDLEWDNEGVAILGPERA